jgi:chromosome segregation ATPase
LADTETVEVPLSSLEELRANFEELSNLTLMQQADLVSLNEQLQQAELNLIALRDLSTMQEMTLSALNNELSVRQNLLVEASTLLTSLSESATATEGRLAEAVGARNVFLVSTIVLGVVSLALIGGLIIGQ